MLPLPENVRLIEVPESVPAPARLGNDPVAPAKFPVPPVTVADAVPLPRRISGEPVRVPVIVPSPPDKVMVYGPDNVAIERDPLNVPLPIPLSVAVPVAVTPPLALNAAAAVTFNVV